MFQKGCILYIIQIFYNINMSIAPPNTPEQDLKQDDDIPLLNLEQMAFPVMQVVIIKVVALTFPSSFETESSFETMCLHSFEAMGL